MARRRDLFRFSLRLRLRHKLSLSLSVAALLPVAVAAQVAVSLVLKGLDNDMREDAGRQLHVGLNLLLRQVERLGVDAVRLASSGDLQRAMNEPADSVFELLARESPHLPSALVQIADASGELVAERVIGGVEARFRGLAVARSSPIIRAGQTYERRVTLVPVADVLVVRAVAPIVDASYRLQGVVVMSVPLDGDFADGVKAALGTDVLIYAGTGASITPAMSTFLDPSSRTRGIRVPAVVMANLEPGRTMFTREIIGGREFQLGYTPLMNLQGAPVGVFAVAVDRQPLAVAKTSAMRSLVIGAAGAVAFALVLAALLSRRLTRPLHDLHRGAIAIARGDLDHRIQVAEGDEIGDLATAFGHMTRALKDNQERLAARMREIVALHDAGRAVGSVIGLDAVLGKIVDSVARVFEVRLCALWVAQPEPGRAPTSPPLRRPARMRLGAARAKPLAMRSTVRGEEGAALAMPLAAIADEVARARATLRIDRVNDDPARRDFALAAGITGSLLATPLERKGGVIGVLIVGRGRDSQPFSEADSSLLATFADQAAAAVENARLYEEVVAASEELEGKVWLRTAELTHMNTELGRALSELRETQSQLILSERLAGLGLLVAGVAHEVNSPSAAIRGSVDALADGMVRLSKLAAQVAELGLTRQERALVDELIEVAAPALASERLPAAAEARRRSRSLSSRWKQSDLGADASKVVAKALAEVGASDALVTRFVALVAGAASERAVVLSTYFVEHVYLHRTAATIRNGIRRIQHIVGALKSYSHLDQSASLTHADLHEGLEDTLVLLDYVLRDSIVSRKYGTLPAVPVYVDELNQVWTNLLLNAVQALQGQKGSGHITIETRQRVNGAGEAGVVVRVIDDGPGIPDEVRPHVFEPFYTTKPKGEGTGLGLGIVRQIIDKHGGEVDCQSVPGETVFEVWLPLRARPAGDDQVAS